ncbi:MAG: ANTAR domain-containing response regulator [Alcanivoracaceae bacterium]
MLRVLVIDDTPGRGAILEQALVDAGCEVLERLSTSQDMLAKVETLQPDLILIDIDSPDRDTLESLGKMNQAAPRPVVMFAENSDASLTEKALKAGVSAYVVDGLQPGRVKAIMDLAIARFREYKALRDELSATRNELAERKLIDRAKGILMKRKKLDEEQAYQMLRKLAMNKGKRLADVAAELIDMVELLG